MKNILIIFITTSLLLFSLSAWSASTKQEVIALKAQIAEMQNDLAEIKKLLKEGAKAPAKRAAEPPFKEQVVSLGSSPVKGNADAPVTMIEYSDYQCPYCARNYRDVLPALLKEYVETGKLKIVMREFPLTSIHGNAMNASMAALCAGDQGKYWEMHNTLFENQRSLSIENLKTFAGNVGLDTTTFNECFDSKKHQKQIDEDLSSGSSFGITGTPAFVLGLTDKEDSDKATLSMYRKGARGISFFRQDINKLLESIE